VKIKNKVNITRMTESLKQIPENDFEVLFELIDNSIDAGASKINIINDGAFIFEDNGVGMNQDSLNMYFNGFESTKDYKSNLGCYGYGTLLSCNILSVTSKNIRTVHVMSKQKKMNPYYVLANFKDLSNLEVGCVKSGDDFDGNMLFRDHYKDSLQKKAGQGTYIYIKNPNRKLMNLITKEKHRLIDDITRRYGKHIVKNKIIINLQDEIIDYRRVNEYLNSYNNFFSDNFNCEGFNVEITLYEKDKEDLDGGVLLYLGDDFKDKLRFNSLRNSMGSIFEDVKVEVVIEKNSNSFEHFSLNKTHLKKNKKELLLKNRIEVKVKDILELYEQDKRMDLEEDYEDYEAPTVEDTTEEDSFTPRETKSSFNRGHYLEYAMNAEFEKTFNNHKTDKSKNVFSKKNKDLKNYKKIAKINNETEFIKGINAVSEDFKRYFNEEYMVKEDAKIEFLEDRNESSSVAEFQISTVYQGKRRLNNFGVSIKLDNESIRHPPLKTFSLMLGMKDSDVYRMENEFKKIFKRKFSGEINTKGKSLTESGCYKPIVKELKSTIEKIGKSKLGEVVEYLLSAGNPYIKVNVKKMPKEEKFQLGHYEVTDYASFFRENNFENFLKAKIKSNDNSVVISLAELGTIVIRVKNNSASNETIDTISFKLNVDFLPSAEFKNKYTSIVYY